MSFSIHQVVNLRAIVLDELDCLFDRSAARLSALAKVGAAKGLRADWQTVDEAWRRQTRSGVKSGAHPGQWASEGSAMVKALRAVLRDHCERPLSKSAIEELAREARKGAAHRNCAIEINTLRNEAAVILATDSELRLALELCRDNNIELDAILSADFLRARRYDSRYWERLVTTIGYEREQVLVVSTDDELLKRAKHLGCLTAWLNSSGDETQTQAAEMVIQNLSHLHERLLAIAGNAKSS